MSILLQNITISVITSLVASLIFCFLSFRYTGVDIWFGNALRKSPSTGEHYGNYRYRIVLGNNGLNDLLEISVRVKITVVVKEKSHFTYLEAGNQGFLPVLAGKKSGTKFGNNTNKNILTLSFSDIAYKEFQKSFYPLEIQLAAARKTLSLDKIFETFHNSLKIEVFVFGNAAISGIRKMYYKCYLASDVENELTIDYAPKVRPRN